MAKFSYRPSGVCCRMMEIETNGDVVGKVTFIGGCDGNLQGVAKLVEGRNIDTVIELLKGIDCRGKGTSCPDQLACALAQNK